MCSTEHMSTEPPQFTRYRLIEFYPERLTYKGGHVLLTFRGDRDNCWMFYAVKENDPTRWIEIMRRPTMHEWACARFEGFDVVSGSPADRIMKRLVKEGGAIVMASGEKYFPKRTEKQKPYH
jgi:hypothetical protein